MDKFWSEKFSSGEAKKKSLTKTELFRLQDFFFYKTLHNKIKFLPEIGSN